jgi:hypothetical protein
MIGVEPCELLARYNRWMNARMIAAAATLDRITARRR